MGVVVAALRVVPAWAWVLAAALAWGGWHRWHAQRERQAFDEARVEARVANAAAAASAAQESARRARAMQEVTDAEILRRRDAEAVAGRLADAERRLRLQLAAAARPGAADPAAASGSEAAAGTAGVPAELLGECAGRVRSLAAAADASRAAGLACERAFDALTESR